MFRGLALRLLLIALLLAALSVAGRTQLPPVVYTYAGTFADGAIYLIQYPTNWNGTLVLYSHGYIAPGSGNNAYDVGDSYTGNYLLTNGYALAGSSYATTGWAVHEALPDQIATLDKFQFLTGQHPQRTIAWGHSMGGLITAALVQQYPSRFQGALPMCGVTAGGVGFWNQALDAGFAFQLLLAPGVQVVNISDPIDNLGLADTVLNVAQTTSGGRARIALIAALNEVTGWVTVGQPPPPPGDYADEEVGQYDWLGGAVFPFTFYYRAELETRAGGNPSLNTGVDYAAQLNRSAYADEVRALYQQAHLDLNADLQALNAAPRISANPSSLTYLEQNIDFYRPASIPVLTLHTEGDGLVVPENESSYRILYPPGGNNLRQLYIHRAGHCSMAPGETLAAFEALVRRMDTQVWSGLSPQELNQEAYRLYRGGPLNAPAFDDYMPGPFLRPFYGYPH
jgi:pimeloyl-ACP methyl ester carboxylesterase